ncbi:MAG TPA: hypothetical protein PKX59_10115 [Bacteroidia bacterium]|nr:hypothetical protein [Bacteroidia bacterium]
MQAHFPIRYGRNYKVVMAIVLPCLLIWPFIEALQLIKPLEEWLLWVSIFGFLGIISAFSVWLATRVYPEATLSIHNNQVSLKFNSSNFLSPADFTFTIADITSFTRGEVGSDEYYIIITQNPRRKFQLSASTYKVEDMLLFNQAMVEISEKVRGVNS